MRFPLEVLLDQMSYLHPDIRLSERNQWIKGINLMPRDASRLDPEMLYFCVEPERIPRACTAPYIASAPDPSISQLLENCVILPAGTDIIEVFNEALRFQTHMHDWLQAVDISVGKGEGIQSILDLSEKVLGNPIVVITPAFRLVAATRDLETSDLVFQEFYNLGYLTQETWNTLRDNDYYRSEYYTGQTIVLPQSATKDYTSTLTAVVHKGEVGFLILMLCSNFAYTPGVAQIYRFILGHLQHYLQPMADNSSFRRTQFDYLVMDILQEKISTPKEIRERSSILGVTYDKAYHTVLIQLEQSSDMYLAHELQTLSMEFPGVYSLLYESRILMHFERSAVSWPEQLESLNSILESSHANAGISEPLSGMESIRESYRQAEFALECGLKMLGQRQCNHYLGDEMDFPRLFSFAEYHVFSMLSGQETEASLLARIRQYDKDHGTDYHRILFIYLSSERNFTHSAKLLHMHRNNVIYHIRRMSEIFSLDLDKPTLRLRILMLYKLEDLHPPNASK